MALGTETFAHNSIVIAITALALPNDGKRTIGQHVNLWIKLSTAGFGIDLEFSALGHP